MLYTYILRKDRVNEYFPDTEAVKNYEDSTNIQNDLVCIKSNKWMDIPKKDKYIPFSFRCSCDLEPERLKLLVKYIESVTDAKGIYLITSKDMDLPGRCLYQCYIGEDNFYITESEANDLKTELSYFEKGDVFVISSERIDPCEDQISKEGIIFSPHGKNIKSGEKKYHKQKEIDLVFGENKKVVPEEHLESLENENLPKYTLPTRKLFGFVESFLREEDPIHTPYKLSKQLDKGGIDFINYDNILKMLKTAPEVEVESHISEDPSLFILSLRVNEIPFLVCETDGISEVIYSSQEDDQPLIDPQNIDSIITMHCKNHSKLIDLPPRKKLEIFVHDDHGVVFDPEKMDYFNPYTRKLFPPSIIHTCGVSWKGFEIPSGSYDPHKNVHIQVPLEVVFENLGKSISIMLKTHQEECYLDQNFHYSPDMVQEEELKHLIRKLWKKGYLHDDYGLANLIYYNNVVPGHIEKPWWFQGKTPEQARDLISFIEQF